MKKYYLNAATAEMRAAPDLNSEVISQAIFSEEIQPLQYDNEWIKIQTCLDNYTGWIHAMHSIVERDISYPNCSHVIVDRCAAHIYRNQDTIYGPIETLPYESKLEIIDESDPRWIHIRTPSGLDGFIQRGDIREPGNIEPEEVIPLSYKFLGLPYTWGGRSSFGYDCSGYVQMLYRRMGIHLPRDSKDQCSWENMRVVSLDELMANDLIFFGYSSDKIRHVGMAIDREKFIHTCASTENMPYVRISRLTDSAWNGTGLYPYRIGKRLI